VSRMTPVALGLILCLAAAGIRPARAADGAPGLELKPCVIELVDGAKVEGQLANQFDIPGHLIVYSPRLSTLRSFLKRHVHALTVEGERRELNSKRTLADEDRRLIGEARWPDAPPAEGHRPEYTREKWEAPERLLVWASPGKSGRLRDASGWLVNGKPFESLPQTVIWSGPTWNRSQKLGEFDEHTDILVPAAEKGYSVRGGAHWHTSKRFLARHVMGESGGSFKANVKSLFGNLWISAESDFHGGGYAYFRGTRHTFVRNGNPRPVGGPILWSDLQAKAPARKWVLRKDDPDASMAIPRRIDITIWAGVDVSLDGVVFDDARAGGIRLQDPAMRETWRHVFFGERNAGPPEALFARYVPSEERRKEVAEKAGPDGSVDRFFGVPLYVRDNQPTWEARVQPVGGQFPAGQAVTVSLNVATNQQTLDAVELRYTLDGSNPTAQSTRSSSGPCGTRSNPPFGIPRSGSR